MYTYIAVSKEHPLPGEIPNKPDGWSTLQIYYLNEPTPEDPPPVVPAVTELSKLEL